MLLESVYPFARNLLFKLDAERAHHLTLRALSSGQKLGFLRGKPLQGREVEVMGLRFENPLGLAAGLDKDAVAVDAFGGMGFGSIEVGTLTPRPQTGNALPRLFRLPEHEALINRMGFNNHGIEAAVARLSQRKWSGVVGVNIGKNKDTPNEQALDDYLVCLELAAPVADYITVNLSSPNTPQLRALLEPQALRALLKPLLQRRAELAKDLDKALPLLVKVTPDHELDELPQLAAVFNELGVQGVIATNTTLSREGVHEHALAGEQGGLSGAPLRENAVRTLEALRELLDEGICLVASGGVMSAADIAQRLDLGAALVQLYTGFIYQGPKLVTEGVKLT